MEGGKQTAYGATLAEFKPEKLEGVYDSNPADKVFKGKLVIGDAAPKMKVSQTALYHIVLDLNKAKDLSDAQILLCPVTWGVRGEMNSWGFTELKATEAKNEGITYTLTGVNLKGDGGDGFKFAYNSAWKITLDDKGEVKANTNLGKDCKPGGDNIKSPDAGLYDITLKFALKGGDLKDSFTITLDRKGDMAVDPIDPAGKDFMVGFSGTFNEWGNPNPNAFIVKDLCKVTDAAKFSGSYVFGLTDFEIPADAEFKVRINGEWLGVGQAELVGLETTGDGNFKAVKGGVFDVKFEFDWDGKTNVASKIKVTFEDAGEAPAPTPKIDGDFSEWEAIEAIPGDGVIKNFKMNYVENMLYFYLELDKAKMNINEALSFAHKVFFCFVNADGEFAQDIWLMINGAPQPTTWGLAGFAGKGVVDGDLVKFEISFSNTVNPILTSDGFFYGAYVDGQYCDNSSGEEVWGGEKESIGNAPEAGEEMAVWGEEPVLPEPDAVILIDGDMSDWADIEGVEQEPAGEEDVEEGAASITAVKGYVDDNNVYVYIKRDKVGRWKKLWGGDSENAGYYYYDFDLDNNPETGDQTEGSHGNWEAFCYLYIFGGTYDAPVFRVTPPGSGKGVTIDNVTCAGIVTETAVETEISFPRADLPEITGDTITVGVWGNKDAVPFTKVTIKIAE